MRRASSAQAPRVSAGRVAQLDLRIARGQTLDHLPAAHGLVAVGGEHDVMAAFGQPAIADSKSRRYE
jgi:hypothetical protein